MSIVRFQKGAYDPRSVKKNILYLDNSEVDYRIGVDLIFILATYPYRLLDLI